MRRGPRPPSSPRLLAGALVAAMALGVATPVLPGGRDVPDTRYLRGDTPPSDDPDSEPNACRGHQPPVLGAGSGESRQGRDLRTRLEVLYRRLMALLTPRAEPPAGCPS